MAPSVHYITICHRTYIPNFNSYCTYVQAIAMATRQPLLRFSRFKTIDHLRKWLCNNGCRLAFLEPCKNIKPEQVVASKHLYWFYILTRF